MPILPVLSRVCAWLAVAALSCALFPACKRTDPSAVGAAATPAKSRLGFAIGPSTKVFVTVRGHQEAPTGRRDWQMSSTLELRLQDKDGLRAYQGNSAPWQGKLAPAAFAGSVIAHAVPIILLDDKGRATGFDNPAGLSNQVQSWIEQARARLDDPVAVQAMAGDGQRVAAEVDRFWNHLWLAHQRAVMDFVPGSEKLYVNDPVLGPNTLVNVEASRSERPCPTSAGGGTCLQTQLTLRPDKVTVLEATRRIAGLLPPETSVTAYNVEDRLVLLTRQSDHRVLEFSDERRTRTTASPPGGRAVEVRDFEHRRYSFGS